MKKMLKIYKYKQLVKYILNSNLKDKHYLGRVEDYLFNHFDKYPEKQLRSLFIFIEVRQESVKKLTKV